MTDGSGYTSQRRSPEESGDDRERPAAEARPVYMANAFDGPSTLELLNVLLWHRKLLVVLPVAVAMLAVGHGLLSGLSYSSPASFTPEGKGNQLSQLGGLAAQFGVDLPDPGVGGESPQFYADLLHSTHLLGKAVDTRYQVPEGADGRGRRRVADLVELYGVAGETALLRRDAAIERLRNKVAVETDEQTGVVRFTVTTSWSSVSRQVAERLVELVQQFNVGRRRLQAEEERQFLEERVREAQEDLLASEDSLETFLKNNRNFENSPTLRFEHERLQRRVSLQQQVHTSLAQSLEEAKIQAVRNTPVITVVEPPREPVRPDSRMLAVRGILGLLIGGMAASFWAFGSRLITDARKNQADHYEEFERLRREALEDIRRLARWLLRRDREKS